MVTWWRQLGIAETTDRTAIRRAYAARLKAIGPDPDPQAFAALRTAYDGALAAASEPLPAPQPDGAPALAPLVETVPFPEPDAPDARNPLDVLLRQADLAGAVDWLLAARPSSGLQQDLVMTDRLGWAMAQDRALPADAVRLAAERLGWLATAPAGPWAAPLHARLEAEHWLSGLERDAATRRSGARQHLCARIMLGHGASRPLRRLARDRMLRRLYGEYLIHQAVVGSRFDAARMDAVALTLSGEASRPRSTFKLLIGIGIIAWGCGLLVDAIWPGTRDAVVWVATVLLMLARTLRGR